MPRFVFDDIDEPPPPRWGRRVLVVAVALVVLAGAVVGVAAWVGRGAEPDRAVAADPASTAPSAPSPTTPPSATPPPAAPVSGVLFGDPDTGQVGVSSPSGATARVVTTVARSPGSGSLFAAVNPERTTVLFPDGSTLELATGRVTPAPAPGPIGVIPRQPWAASGMTLSLQQTPGGLLQPQLGAHGSFTLLGSASAFAADPRFAGVFAVGTEVGATGPSLLHEGQLPAAGAVGADVTLASEAQLASMVGLPAGATITLGTPVVTADGSEVAVPVSASTDGADGPETTGWAVVGADGHAVAAVPATPGRPGWAVFSAGKELALSDVPPTGARELRLAAPPHPGARVLELPAGIPADLLEAPCVFSPDAGTLLCGDATHWLSLDVQTNGATQHASAPGVPLAWVAGASS